MQHLTDRELVGILFFNVQAAQRLNWERFPQRDVLDRWMFLNVHHNLPAYGSLRSSSRVSYSNKLWCPFKNIWVWYISLWEPFSIQSLSFWYISTSQCIQENVCQLPVRKLLHVQFQSDYCLNDCDKADIPPPPPVLSWSALVMGCYIQNIFNPYDVLYFT